MLQNSPSPKCESRNPPQRICEFRKIHSTPIQFGCSRFQIEAMVLRPILYHGGELGIHSLHGCQSSCGRFLIIVVNCASIPCIAANRFAGDFGPKSGRGKRNMNYLCTNAIAGTPHPSLPVWLISDGRPRRRQPNFLAYPRAARTHPPR